MVTNRLPSYARAVEVLIQSQKLIKPESAIAREP